ncbi:MAG: NAD(P)/FAD-dependent oxidoreductase [Sphingomonadales bacterium]|jgi:predicted Rossmann fold flavoprotein|nr:NAD(P)/FAD-dependent oxidoreductase [Sphingomonadales bacterium]MBK9268463.1 NAD(P)/FAD-dependent oxidoreductase [Sphingomonadales bacterium]MBP6433709.1 NAD(P)/FAD-dependent oxidoreductase [Sphingorhabdus sp.]
MKAGNYDAIILGAGGAGLMCAATAGQRGRQVLVIDHASGPGKKILISGGGRCNFTNVNATSQNAQERYISANPHFAKSALGRYEPQDFIDLVSAHGIAFHEKTLGQLFCDGSARQIVAMLMDECDRAAGQGGRVDFAFGLDVRAVSHSVSGFVVAYGNLAASAPRLIVATGGPSIPKMGATGLAYDLARQFGLKVVEPRPALVPLTLGGEDVLFRELSGISAEVVASAGKAAFREAALFTHRGLSGPAILQASSYWSNGEVIDIDFLPDADAAALLAAAKRANPRATLRSTLERHVPGRLAEALAGQLALNGNLADQSDRKLAEAGARMNTWRFHPNGSEGYAKAEVTRGGVATDGLSQKTLEAKTVPGLHFIGEGVDVTGWLGGYNFQWAWASGVAAGEAV